MSKVLSLESKRVKDLEWPVDCLLKKLDDYEELIIIAKKKKVIHILNFIRI
jgi:hypothetical protein